MKTSNLNIENERLLPTPNSIKSSLTITPPLEDVVSRTRESIRSILDRKDQRKIIVVGPCSIHDTKAAIDYAQRLRDLSGRVANKFLILMRVYFEKPRTVSGWKGFINDPFLDDSFKIDAGLYKARELLLQINSMGIGVATEALDPITPQYLDDLISWTAIGARTTESQTHREMASGLSTPVGFKNGTDGNIQVAINALLSARLPHHFLGINQNGQCTVLQTSGNQYGHIVLRGGSKPNYDSESVSICSKELTSHKLPANIMIDCSHANSGKNHENQPGVLIDCIKQIQAGNQDIIGFMIESNIFAGNQKFTGNINDLRYGVSITDACIDWVTTEKVVIEAAKNI
jgi:3-deoxy-7-phosphoheptulonate synthase